MALRKDEEQMEYTNKLERRIHNIEKLRDKELQEINNLRQEMTKCVQYITDLINVTTENTMSIVNLQSIQHKLGKKTDELEKKLNIIEEKTSFLQYEYADLKKKTKKNENLIGNLQDKNNDLVSKIDTLERTMVEVKRQLHEMQHYMYSTYSKISYNGTDHLRKPPAWTTILMEIVSFIILYYGYF